MCFFGTKAFLISAIITVKIIYLGFLASCISGVALIIWISIVLNKLWFSAVSYINSSLVFSLILNLGLDSLSVLFIIKY